MVQAAINPPWIKISLKSLLVNIPCPGSLGGWSKSSPSGRSIPMAIAGGQGSEMWSPMAIAVIGGLTVSTVLTLILIPTLYCVFAGTGIKNQRRKLRRQRELDLYYQENN